MRLYPGPVTGKPSWSHRLRITSNIIHVGAFVVAAGSTIAASGLTTNTAFATALSAVGVLVALATPIPFSKQSWIGPSAVAIGIVLYSVAAALTGGLASSFALLPVASIFLASIGGGLRVAAPAAVASVIGIVVGGAPDSSSVIDIVSVAAIYALTAIAFSEVQRAIMSESERTADILSTTRAALSRAERLTATHDLLEDLVTVATSPDINAVTTAQDTLRDVAVILPDAPARIVAQGEVILARRGTIPSTPPPTIVPISWQTKLLARLELWAKPGEITPTEMSALDQTVAPVGLAIDNDLMLQKLAGLTIQRERLRLARELHDDIAPSIASVGLALDMTLMAGDLSPDQARNLEATRSNVTRLVNTVRDRVQDLRADRSLSLVELAHSLVADVDADGPSIVIDIEERTPPRPAIAAEIGALLTESFRNAINHASASVITVTGRITETGGTLTVEDNGTGFPNDASAEGRFGLLGMKERANLIGAELTISSTLEAGTTVTVTWKEDR
jgi:signal transduction histidine kinase